jgi:hypothetical protein
MPASYAHYRFGKLLLPSLPADVRQTIQRFRRMYDMGLQGPDFFFFCNIFVRTATVQMGSTFHHQTGQEFFPVACKAAASDAAKAYLYGLLGHYCLDSVCHPFVNRLANIGEARHVPLESEFERFLLTLDKEPSPHTFDMSKYIRLTRGECMTVSGFYPGSTGGKVFLGTRAMAFIARFMVQPSRQKQIPFLQRRLPFVYDHMIPMEENPDLAVYIRELYDLYGQALEQYPRMLSQLTAHLETGADFGDLFAADFG